MTERVLDLFAGPGGWDEGLRAAGFGGVLTGVDIDPDACATARAAGHERLQIDLTDLDPDGFRFGDLDGLIGSPVCTTFSPAGLHAGLDDPRGLLVTVPLRWVLDLRPRWVAFEQVRAVLPIWRQQAAVLREAGYRAEAFVVNALDVGVAQDRSRAILLARRDDGPLSGSLPLREDDTPTAASDVLPWSPGDRFGFLRRADRTEPHHVIEIDGVQYRSRDLRLASRPAQTLTEKARSWVRYPAGGGAPVRVSTEEAAALQGFPASGYATLEVDAMTRDELCAALLAAGYITVDAERGECFRARGPGGMTLATPARLAGTRIPDGYLVASLRLGDCRKQVRLHRLVWISVHGAIPEGLTVDHKNGDKSDNRISNLQLLTGPDNSRAAHEAGLCNYERKIPPSEYEVIAHAAVIRGLTQSVLAERYGVTRGRIGQIVREHGYPWHGSRTSQFRQIGNAVPPPLAAALLAPLLQDRQEDLFTEIGVTA